MALHQLFFFFRTCLQNLSERVLNILIYLPCSFFNMNFIRINGIHQQNSTDLAPASKKIPFYFIREIRCPYNQQIVYSSPHFPIHKFKSLSVDSYGSKVPNPVD